MEILFLVPVIVGIPQEYIMFNSLLFNPEICCIQAIAGIENIVLRKHLEENPELIYPESGTRKVFVLFKAFFLPCLLHADIIYLDTIAKVAVNRTLLLIRLKFDKEAVTYFTGVQCRQGQYKNQADGNPFDFWCDREKDQFVEQYQQKKYHNNILR